MPLVSTPEYDAFGPWVLPVSSQEQIPPVFRAHPIDFTRAHDVLKVPRDIERREATPRSHLYDVVLVLGEEVLEVLVRQGHRFTVQRVHRGGIAAVETGTELLQGRFSVLGTDGTRIDVGFNGASLPVIVAFADRLLGWEDVAHERRSGTPLRRDALGLRDVGLVGEYNALPRSGRERRVAAAYGARTPASQQSRTLRLLRGRARLSGAVVGVDAVHTTLVTRADWIRQSRRQDLSSRRVVIPHGAVTAVSSAPHPFLDGVADLSVSLGDARIALAVPSDEADAVAAAVGGDRGRTRDASPADG